MKTFVTLNSNDDKISATQFSACNISDNDPFAGNRRVAFDDNRTRAGIAEFEGSKRVDYYPHWELVIVTSGSLAFAFDATRVTVPAGGALVINRGTRFDVSADAPASWVFLSVTEDLAGNPEPATLAFFDRDAQLFASPSVDQNILVSAAPTCRNHRMHVRDDIKVRAGVWDSTPYERINLVQQEHELMHITKGEVSFSDGNGRKEVYSAGETFLVPKGVNGKWTSNVHVAKIYAVVT